MAKQAHRTQLEQEEAVRDYINRLTLMDDLFMAAVFEDPRCIETVLRVVMGKPDLEVRESRVKQDLINLAGRSAQVDVFAVDGSGKHYDIEVQRNPSGANARRARYYGAVLDAKALEKGKLHQNLPETYVIFITEKDVLRGGLPIYHIGRQVAETGEPYEDGFHILYVNCAYKDDGTPLGDLAHDFRCADPDLMRYNILKERSGCLKGGGEEVAMMSESIDRLIAEFKDRWIAEGLEEGRERGLAEGLEEGREKGRKEGRTEGRAEGAREIARRMLAQNILSREQIADLTSLPIEEVEQLAALRQ